MFESAILYVGLAQSLFASLVISTKKPVSLPDKILIASLLTMAIRFSAKVINIEYPGLINMNFSVPLIPLTFGPYMYLYAYYFIRNGNAKFRKKDLLHFIPISLFLLIYLMYYQNNFTFNEVTYFEKNSFFGVRILFGLFFFSSILLYCIFTFLMIRQYKRELLDHQEYEQKKDQLVWLNFISMFFLTIFLIYLIVGGINALSFEEKFNLDAISNIGLTLLAFVVSYFGVTQSARFSFPERSVPEKTVVPEVPKSKLKFSETEAANHIERLNRYMEEEKPYLDPDLNLNQLADGIGITKYDLTQLLNRKVGKNFFSFVNEYRMQEVLLQLKNQEKKHLTIISIAFDSGFNSKSTFNSLFKQHTGQTPSEYKRNVQTELRPD